MISHSRPHFSRTGLASFLVIALLGLFAVAPATGFAATAAADQYNGGGNAGQGGSGDEGSEAAGETVSGGGSAGGGSLPFSGYPLTPLVLVLGGLIGGGLAIRFGVSAMGRTSAASVGSRRH